MSPGWSFRASVHNGRLYQVTLCSEAADVVRRWNHMSNTKRQGKAFNCTLTVQLYLTEAGDWSLCQENMWFAVRMDRLSSYRFVFNNFYESITVFVFFFPVDLQATTHHSFLPRKASGSSTSGCKLTFLSTYKFSSVFFLHFQGINWTCFTWRPVSSVVCFVILVFVLFCFVFSLS